MRPYRMVESAVEEAEYRGGEEHGHHGVVGPSGRRVAWCGVCVGEKVEVMCGEEVDEKKSWLEMTVDVYCNVLVSESRPKFRGSSRVRRGSSEDGIGCEGCGLTGFVV